MISFFILTQSARQWIETRRFETLWKSLPLLLAGVAWLVFGYFWTRWSPRRTAFSYSVFETRSLASRDFETARVACLRLLSLGSVPREQCFFELAQASAGLGRSLEASKLLQLAAPLAKPGYTPAHLQIVRTLLSSTNTTPQIIRTVEIHLKHALVLDPNSAEANETLGELYLHRGEKELAKKHLTTAAAYRPRPALLLAMMAKDQGDDENARTWAERAVRPFRERVEHAKEDQIEDRLTWAQGLILLEQYSEAVKLLETGQKLSHNPIYNTALGGAYAAWAEALARKQPEDLANRIQIVLQGLELAPQNSELLRLLLDLTRAQGTEADAARKTVSKMLSEGTSGAMLHLMLGNDAWQRGEKEAARTHLRLAFESSPNTPIIANNLATMLSTGDPADLPRALDIIRPVAEKYPDNPHFRDTRGIILAKLGHWEEAIKDLEFALPHTKSPKATHEALALAYRGLRLPDMAVQHERLSKETTVEKKPTPVQAPKQSE